MGKLMNFFFLRTTTGYMIETKLYMDGQKMVPYNFLFFICIKKQLYR